MALARIEISGIMNSMIKPNFIIDELIEEVRRLAAENPDFVYKQMREGGCSYIKGGDPDKPGCIFGRACINLDPALYDYFVNNDDGTIEKHLTGFKIASDKPKVRWCTVVQQNQDVGVSWSNAVFAADINYPLVEESK